ncbi:VCBS repeat-containing protein [Parafilimonas terrae]|uniref:Repeat domain-containing protein n=1 Tax=Parafilimonas terrae TaxID=1465490 RepID=A0A1I5SBA5_9BACT|nr:VCBS repeat-containing protein [Parafilimonas terrae]SFP68044.1 Repeat domain-containing protein [Parafilimonas terrae]
MKYSSAIFCLLISCMILSCKAKKQKQLFTFLPSTQTGITFSNDIDETKIAGEALNEFAYMGGGVGVTDINNDGLKDLFFCGNQVSSKLYLNKNNNKFEDITAGAGVATKDWITGVSVVDINADGYDDFYLCTYSNNSNARARNLLFINQKNNTFKEAAAEYGLADTGYSTQAAFFDYDKDGDLDMYLSNYMLNASYSANYLFRKNTTGDSPANDRLYRNDGNKNGHPVFTDVSMEAGIKEDGYGLSISVCDFNMDGWPDVFVSNDFISNDNLWLNNKNGTFSNILDAAAKHQSYSSMGSDAADINNDGRFDFASVDMMPENNYRKKQIFSFMNYDRYQEERSMGYSPEFSRNVLQLNNGNYYKGDTLLPFFSEIGQLAGISETDWSWSILFADFDNDGYKDLHITNGIGRDFINADFISLSQTNDNNMGGEQSRQILKDKLVALNHVDLPNYLFRNNGDYTFSNITDSSGIKQNSLSNGAAYIDLDNDGDLDLVVNNINKEAYILINNENQPGKPKTSHSISFLLKGDSLNTNGFGAKLFVYSNGTAQVQEQYPVRGYLSSVDTKLLFGMGNNAKADSVIIIWPNNKKQVLQNINADSTYTLHQKNANEIWQPSPATNPSFFIDVTATVNAAYKHNDYIFNDYAEQRLLPQKYSQLGPFISTGDINNDGKTDFYIGGGFNSNGKVFMQTNNGAFNGRDFTQNSKFEEDAASTFFDADGDGDEDLLVTYGDMRFNDTSMYYQPRLYLNDGKGNFTLSINAIPSDVRTIAGCVAIADYDSDGDMDVFIGGRVSKQYPLPPNTYLLQNNKGVFTNVTNKVCPALAKAGMVTAAQWADYDNDKQPDLIITGEYMPVRFFKNNGSTFKEVTASTGLQNMNGLWRSLIAADVDEDGDTDFIAGNLGLNCNYHASAQYPVKLYAEDIDKNGSIDPLLFYYIKDTDGKRKLYPSINKNQLAMQVPLINKQFATNKDFTMATADKIFGSSKSLLVLTCNETRSCWIENKGNGKFEMHALPVEAQFAPVNAIICADMDGDGIKDILLAGNEYQTEVVTGRYDASYGCFLKGNNQHQFKAVPYNETGLKIDGDIKDMKMITTANNKKLILVAVNDDYLRVFEVR